jgi:hypothetical protein
MVRQTVPIGLVGPSSRAGSITQQSARTINLYPEANDPDAKVVVAMHSAPGIEVWGDLSADGIVRGQHRMGSRLFVMVGPNLYEVTDEAFGSPTLKGVFATESGRVGISDNAGKLIVGDGNFWLIDPDSGVTVPAAILDDGMEQIPGTFSFWIDGYTVYIEADPTNPGRFRYSALNDPATVNGLDFLTAEGDPDQTVAGAILNRNLVLLGERSVQFFYDSGGSDNAFAPTSGGFAHVGCLCRWTAQVFANAVVFIGANDDGEGTVWAVSDAGSEPQRLSSHAVEVAIRTALLTNDAEDFTAYTYDEEGHRFYVLNLPTGTWAFDATTKMWCERAHRNTGSGLDERIRQDFAIFWQGKHRCGAYDSGKIYSQSKDLFADDDTPLIRMRETAHSHAQGRRLIYNRLWIDMETGVGLDGAVDGSEPTIQLQYSDDGGRSYSSEITRSIGLIGETKTRVQFDRLGVSRDRVFRASISHPVKVVLLQALADVTVGA